MVPTAVAGRACHRCGTDLDDLGWATCLRCLATDDDDDLAPDLAGFEDLTPIGRGGMGVVYRAYQRHLDRHVAIKVIDADRADDPAFRERFSREAKLMARLVHPNVAAIYELREQFGVYFLVMELVDGAPVAPAPLARVIQIVDALCEALAAAHALGIVHRDIKPSNVLVRDDGTVKLIDFGIATDLETAPITRTGQVIGTPAYMAPEAQRGGPATPAVDVYAVGVLVRELTRDIALPPRIEDVIVRALAPRPEDRPSIGELRRAITGEVVRPRRIGLAVIAVALVAAAGHGDESRASGLDVAQPVVEPRPAAESHASRLEIAQPVVEPRPAAESRASRLDVAQPVAATGRGDETRAPGLVVGAVARGDESRASRLDIAQVVAAAAARGDESRAPGLVVGAVARGDESRASRLDISQPVVAAAAARDEWGVSGVVVGAVARGDESRASGVGVEQPFVEPRLASKPEAVEHVPSPAGAAPRGASLDVDDLAWRCDRCLAAKPVRLRPLSPTAAPPPPAITPEPGALSLRVRPWAMVSIDGAPGVRVEPPRAALTLAAGTHTIELTNPVTERRERRVVDVAAGATSVLVVSLEAQR